MEFVGILRVLWRFRLLVALCVLPAAAIIYVLSGAAYNVGVGSSSALVDTQRSQTVDLGAQTGADIATLSSRATLLASVMTSSPIKDEIARRAGVPPQDLLGASLPTGGAAGGSPATTKSKTAITITATVPQVESGQVPIIVVATQAPSAIVARRLADASFHELTAQLNSVAGNDKVPVAQRLVVRRLGAATSATLTRGPSLAAAIAAGLFVFLFGCTLIVGTHALVSGWRRAVAMDDAELDDADRLAAAAHESEDGTGAADQRSLFDGDSMPEPDDAVELAEAPETLEKQDKQTRAANPQLDPVRS